MKPIHDFVQPAEREAAFLGLEFGPGENPQRHAVAVCGAHQAHVHGSGGNLQQLCDLLAGKPVVIAERDDGPGCFIQRLERVRDHRMLLAPAQLR